MPFDIVAEIEPPVGRDTTRLREQVGALDAVASTVLVPDNHLGRPCVSSLVVAAGIAAFPAIACLNARDRNLLGVQRDVLTAQHLGIEELLVLRGDDPPVGERAGGVGVRDLVEACEGAGVRYSVTSGTGRLPAWKRGASRVFLQVGWSIDDLERRRERLDTEAPVYAGVLVLPSAAVARRLGDRVPELRPPDALIDALEGDRLAGVRAAADLVVEIGAAGAFAGVHLVPGVRSAEIAAALVDRRALDHRAVDHRSADRRAVDRRAVDHRAVDHRAADREEVHHDTRIDTRTSTRSHAAGPSLRRTA